MLEKSRMFFHLPSMKPTSEKVVPGISGVLGVGSGVGSTVGVGTGSFVGTGTGSAVGIGTGSTVGIGAGSTVGTGSDVGAGAGSGEESNAGSVTAAGDIVDSIISPLMPLNINPLYNISKKTAATTSRIPVIINVSLNALLLLFVC